MYQEYHNTQACTNPPNKDLSSDRVNSKTFPGGNRTITLPSHAVCSSQNTCLSLVTFTILKVRQFCHPCFAREGIGSEKLSILPRMTELSVAEICGCLCLSQHPNQVRVPIGGRPHAHEVGSVHFLLKGMALWTGN